MTINFLTEKEFATIIRRSPETIRQWRRSGRGPRWIKIGGRILYEADSVKDFLRAAARSPGGSAQPTEVTT
jgi:hypothetical protein